MALLINSTEFNGKFNISQNSYTNSDLDEYLYKYEKMYLQDLLGCELYDLFESDLVNGIPQTQRFIDLYNEICIDRSNTFYGYYNYEYNCRVIRSEGMKEMLLGFCYWEYVRDQWSRNTIVGNVKNVHSNSQPLNPSSTDINNRYNNAVETYKAIQMYICDNSATYPEFNGMRKTNSINI